MPVSVAGMHRSGTSMVAKLLHLAGLYLGQEEDISGPAPDNLDGFWENAKFVKLNDRLLAVAGGGWDCPRPLPRDWEDLEEFFPLRVRAELLLAEFSGREPWGWKDPRNSITLPFWERFLPQLPVVVCVRNPLEVVRSLQRRNHLSFELGVGLWKTYAESVLQNTSPETRIVTHYESFFSNPEAEIRRLLGFLKLPASDPVVELCLGAVSEGLRHNRSSHQELGDGVDAEVRDLYAQLSDEAGWPPELIESGAGEAAGAEGVTEAAPVLSELDPLRAQVAERERLERGLRTALARKTIERDCLADLAKLRGTAGGPEPHTLRTLFPELSQRLVEEQKRLETAAKLSERIAALQEETGLQTAQHARTTAELHELIRERDATISALQTKHDRGSMALQATLNERIGERDETIRSLRAELDDKTRDELAHRALSERVAQYGLAVERTHADLQTNLYAQIQERDKTIRALETAAQDRTVERNETIQRIHAETKSRLAELDRESRQQLKAAYEKVADRDTAIQRLAAETSARVAGLTGEHRRELAALRDELTKREEARQRLEAELVSREDARRRLEAELADRETKLRVLDVEKEHREAKLVLSRGELNALTRRLAERDAAIRALDAQFADRERAQRETETSLYERLLGVQETVRSLEVQKDNALHDVKWRSEQLERLQHETEAQRQGVALTELQRATTPP